MAAMNAETQKHHGTAKHSNAEESVTSSQSNQNKNDGSIELEDVNQEEYDETVEFEDSYQAEDKEISQSVVKHDEALELFESRLDKLESAILLQSGVQQLRLHVDEEISALKEEMDKLRNSDTVTVTWTIEEVDKTLISLEGRTRGIYSHRSQRFHVGQFKMRLIIEIVAASRQLAGIYLYHYEGFDWTSIEIDKSELSLVGIRGADTITNRYLDDSRIEQVRGGKGWKAFVFFSMKDLKEKYVKNDKLTIKANVRVKRMNDVAIGSSRS